MKGTFFQKPLEFSLTVDGEHWRQGAPVSGTLTIRNHGTEAVSLADVQVILAHGALSKVRQKATTAFKPLLAVPVPFAQPLAPGEQVSGTWTLTTDRNCPISDGTISLFVLYGLGSDTTKLGQLQLSFQPDEVIQEFLRILQTRFRFVQKLQKWSKGWVDTKLVPPDSRSFASLEQLVISASFEEDRLQVAYGFQVKKVEASAAAVELKSGRKELEQEFSPADYRRPSGRLDDERFEAAIHQALSEVGHKL